MPGCREDFFLSKCPETKHSESQKDCAPHYYRLKSSGVKYGAAGHRDPPSPGKVDEISQHMLVRKLQNNNSRYKTASQSEDFLRKKSCAVPFFAHNEILK